MFFASTLLASACVLPSVMGLTLNTPATAAQDGTLAVTWTTVAGDPTFALELVGATSTFDVATGVVPTTLSNNVGLGQIPPGTYTLQAVTGDSIDTVLSTTSPFTITAAAAAAAAPPAAAPPAAAPPAAAPPAAAPPAAAPPAAAPPTAAPPAAAPPAAAPAVPAAPAAGGPPFDPSGAKNVGNGKGIQFIGAQCLSAADCASGCCAGPSGICSGVGAQTEAGKTGCGFVSTAPAPAARALVAARAPAAKTTVAKTTAKAAKSTAKATNAKAGKATTTAKAAKATAKAGKSTTTATAKAGKATVGGPAFDPAGAKAVGNGKGQQFLGGQCLSAADCASACCAGPSGICSTDALAKNNGKTGCGFVSKRFISRSRRSLFE